MQWGLEALEVGQMVSQTEIRYQMFAVGQKDLVKALVASTYWVSYQRMNQKEYKIPEATE